MPISEQITEAGGTFIGTDELGDSIFYFGAQSLAIDMRRPGEQDIARGIGPDGKPAAPILVTVAPGPLIEAVSTGTGDDLVQGSDLDTNIENIFGGAGDDTLNGNGGDDALNGDTGRDRLFGGPGNDRIAVTLGDPARDLIVGGPGRDALSFFGGNLPAGADPGPVSIALGNGRWQDTGALGPLRLRGVEDVNAYGPVDTEDRLSGNGSTNRLDGKGGADVLLGRGGDDALIGGPGFDRLVGGGGDDDLLGGEGRDTLIGGGGNDDLEGDEGHDRALGRGGDDTIEGGAGNDTILGQRGADSLSGDGGFGGRDGNDLIRGHAGADTIEGGGGNDTLDPGRGADVLIFEDQSGRDRVIGWEPRDTLDLAAVDAIVSFADLAADHLEQDGADAVIRWAGASVRLVDVDVEALAPRHFDFDLG